MENIEGGGGATATWIPLRTYIPPLQVHIHL